MSGIGRSVQLKVKIPGAIMPISILLQIYIVAASVGSIFLVICAVMGGMRHAGAGHSGGHGAVGHGGGGHGAIGHGGGGHAALGHGGGGHAAIGHGGGGHGAVGHGAGGGQGVAGHGGAGHGGAVHGTGAAGHGAVAHGTGAAGHGAAGHAAAGAGHGVAGHGTAGGVGGQGEVIEVIQGPRIQSITNPFHVPAPNEHGFVEQFLGLINPTSLSAFLAFFGLSGIFMTETFPWLSIITLIPAFVIGVGMTKIILNLMAFAFARAFSTSAVDTQDLVGRMAEVTIPITAGRTGEIQYVAQSKRFNSAAKCRTEDQELKRGTKVMILETSEKCMIVDVWTDSFQDPNFDGKPQS